MVHHNDTYNAIGASIVDDVAIGGRVVVGCILAISGVTAGGTGVA